jgi:ketosteroid isomerase-like protein
MGLNEELIAFAEQFGAAASMGDAGQLTDLYADDAVFMTHGLPVAAGRTELYAMFSDDPAPGSMSIQPGEFVLDSGELVVEVGSYLTANHDGTNVRPGKYVAVYRRQPDGSLKLAVHVPVRVA